MGRGRLPRDTWTYALKGKRDLDRPGQWPNTLKEDNDNDNENCTTQIEQEKLLAVVELVKVVYYRYSYF